MAVAQDIRLRAASIALHLTAAGIYIYALFWQATHPEPPAPPRAPANLWKTGGRFKFLTYWDNWIQALCHLLLLTADVLSIVLKSRSPVLVRLLKFRDLFFNAVASPVGIFVGLTFWVIYGVDRELIFPRSIEPWYPQWLNHVTHTSMLVFLPLEMYINRHPLPRRSIGLSLLGALIAGYMSWTLYLGLVVGFWAYPVLHVLPMVARVLFIVFCTGSMMLLYFANEQLQNRIWSSGRSKSKGASKELPAERPAERTLPPRRAKQVVKRD